MKEILSSLYGINTLSFIKITNKTYHVKTDKEDYYLKYIESNSLDHIIEKLKILNIDFFLFPIPNKNNEYVSRYNNTNFVLYKSLEEEKFSLKDLKIKFFLTSLATLHNKTFYTIKVNEKFFKDTYTYIGNKIDEVELKIENYMNKIIKLDYKSPSSWLFLLNYPLYINAINNANNSLEKFKELVINKTSIRMAFTYSCFSYDHIFLKESKIIGVDNIELSPPIYDIFYSLSTTNELNVDLKDYYKKYFKSFILDDYEKVWLYTLLYIPRLEIENDEVKNVMNISSSLNYLKNMNELIEMIKDLGKQE